MKKLIGYCRVSTKEQGKTKNGLEAQAEAIRLFAHYNGYQLVEIVQEVASGALGLEDRPVLADAIKRASKAKDTYIVVNKLDRLSRDAEFILGFVRRNPRFIVTMLGENVDPFMLHIYAGLAEKERAMISDRTRAALQAKRARGEALGASKAVLGKAHEASGKAVSSQADAFAVRLKPTVMRMVLAGMTYRQIAEELNENGTKTARGGEWHGMTVRNLVERLNALS